MHVKCRAVVDESASQALGAQNNKHHSGRLHHMSSENCHGILSTGCLWQSSSLDAALVGVFPFISRIRKTGIWGC